MFRKDLIVLYILYIARWGASYELQNGLTFQIVVFNALILTGWAYYLAWSMRYHIKTKQKLPN